jgi:hypothetical protein
MAAPNIALAGYIEGKTDVLKLPQSLLNTATCTITSNDSGSGCVYKINILQVANVWGSAAIDVVAAVRRGGTNYFLADVVAVPADGSLVIIGKENPIYLNEGDSIVLASEIPPSGTVPAPGVETLHGICSYEIISVSTPQ